MDPLRTALVVGLLDGARQVSEKACESADKLKAMQRRLNRDRQREVTAGELADVCAEIVRVCMVVRSHSSTIAGLHALDGDVTDPGPTARRSR